MGKKATPKQKEAILAARWVARFGTHEAQVAHRDELQARLRREFAARTTAEAVEALEAVDILRVKVNTLAEVLADPQVAHNQMVMEMHHPMVGRIRTVGISVKMRLRGRSGCRRPDWGSTRARCSKRSGSRRRRSRRWPVIPPLPRRHSGRAR